MAEHDDKAPRMIGSEGRNASVMRLRVSHWVMLCAAIALTLAPLPSSPVELDSIARAAADFRSSNPKLEAMYRAALLNTSRLATIAPDGTAYVKTGDIPAEYTGMIWTGFRPSDDACRYNYLIPAEMMAVVALGELEEIERDVYHNLIKAQRAASLRSEVQNGIQTYGEVLTPNYGYVYAYEVDGFGNAVLMDDANIPSLLSAPYIGYTKATSTVYQNTRRYLLSKDNPYYYTGSVARGIGSAHTPDNYVWPLALIMQGMTSTNPQERQDVLNQLLASDPGDHLLHEAFDPNAPTKFTRRDFGWPNALFSEFIMTSFNGVPPLPTGSTADLDFRGD